MAYIPPTIKMKGGLRVHMEQFGARWDKFIENADEPLERVSNGALAKLISPNPKKPFTSRTVAFWRSYYKDERDGKV